MTEGESTQAMVVVGEIQPPSNLTTFPHRTLADLIAEVILRGRSKRTRQAYRSDLQDFLIWQLGAAVTLPTDPDSLRTDPQLAAEIDAAVLALRQVTEADISRYLDHLSAHSDGSRRACTPATLNRRMTPLRLLFQRLLRYHLIAVNPMEFIKSRKVSNVSPTLYLNRAQARVLEEACEGLTLRDLRDRAVIVFMLATGVRSAEALSLTIADLGSVDGHQVAWVTGKGGGRERVKVAPRADRALRAYLDQVGITEGAIFRRLRPKGRAHDGVGGVRSYAVHGALSYEGLKYILRARFAAAGLASALSPHSLRHSFITLALRGGAGLPMVQAAARHASPQTTMRYAHDMDSLDNNAVDYVNW